jgi:group I intron endonuclease
MYIGFSVNIYNRIMEHIVYNCKSNAHLLHAIIKYGLATFSFKIVELCASDKLLERSQFWLNWLNWLFSLP